MNEIRRFVPMVILAIAAITAGTGDIRAGDELVLQAPAASNPAAARNIDVFVKTVADKRIFQDDPPSPDLPSMASGMGKAMRETMLRTIGRARNGYGKALHNVYLRPGDTVEKVMRQVVENALKSAGFTVVAQPAPAAIVAEVAIPKFWGWVRVDMGAMYMDGAVTTDIVFSGGKKPLPRLTVSGAATNRLGIGVTARNWLKLYKLLLEDYTKNALAELQKI